ncbi:copper resistance protein B [Stenotrophomonas maltophilia]|nr:copper resistance protein B [Stenotrophomonas maltophilia]MCD0261741.1 copper resistance protein B [Xanthomonas campestris pv. campestris]MCD0269885.1 copper resistance protein B [Xanthomonas campestris pv. campestris]HEL4100811.1 copper resistance protein B [Stenotrophomonas maltophilia]
MKPTRSAFTLLIAVALASPAFGQTMDHSKISMTMPEAPKPEPQADASKTSGPNASKRGTDHSGMQHETPEPKGMDHDMSSMQEGDMATDAMDHSKMVHDAPSSTMPRTPIPVVTDVDRAAAVAPSEGHATGDNAIHSYMLLDRLEAWDADPGTGLAWEGQGWIGTDLNRLWLRSEGERSDGRTEAADLELLYGRSIATWWDLVAGVRQDFKPGRAQTFAAIGVQGLAPQKFEVEATAYFGERGQFGARFEAEYELLLTNRLILQPMVGIEAYGKNDPARGIGAGLSTAEFGLRLRYEFTRKFAPYIGLVHERALGNTADLRRNELESADDTRIVVGLRTWF